MTRLSCFDPGPLPPPPPPPPQAVTPSIRARPTVAAIAPEVSIVPFRDIFILGATGRVNDDGDSSGRGNRRAEGPAREDGRPERVARGHPAGHRHLRRFDRGPSVDPHRRGAGKEGESLRHDGGAWEPHPLAHRGDATPAAQLEWLQTRGELRLEQGPVPRTGSRRLTDPDHRRGH